MRIFLTGGTGYVGSAVLEALVRGGHAVDALVRHSQGAAVVQARGATPVLGALLDLRAIVLTPRAYEPHMPASR